MENGIEGQYKTVQGYYDNMWKTFVEQGQVSTAYTSQMKDVFVSMAKAKYGENGTQAGILLIQEQNPNIDSAVFTKMQTAIEAGRAGFKTEQEHLNDMVREYKNYIEVFPSNIYARILGFPKINLDEYIPMTSAKTDKSFETKQDEPTQIFNK
jgi:hypothetical protein